MRRWTKNIGKGHTDGESMSIHSDAKKAALLRYTSGMLKCKAIADKTCKHEGAHQFFMDQLNVLSTEILTFFEPSLEAEDPNHIDTRRNLRGDLFDDSAIQVDKSLLLDPASVSTKGGSSTKIKLSEIERATSKKRKCKLYNQSGHNGCSPKTIEGDTWAESTTIEQGLPSNDNMTDELQISLDVLKTGPRLDLTRPGFES